VTTRPLPPHGTRARYMRGCSCTDCFTANSRYCKEARTHLHREGHGKRLDPAPVRARIRYWESLGYSHGQLAAAAGVARRVIDAHAKGTLTSINPASANKIMGARLGSHNIPEYLPVNAVGTRRRIQALMVLGHPLKAIAAATGHTALSKLLNGHCDGVRPSTAQDIAELYERWQHTPGNCVRTKKRAAAAGWHGPLDWDDDIDDPKARPLTDDAVELITTRQLAQQRRDEVVFLADAGATPHTIAPRVGLCLSRVREILREERPVLYRHLAATSDNGPNHQRSAA